MSRSVRALAIACTAISATSLVGGMLTLAQEPSLGAERAAVWYFVARAAAVLVAATIAVVGTFRTYSWATDWVFAVAVITLVTQVLDVPILLLVRQDPALATFALGFAALVAMLMLRARRDRAVPRREA
jgi:hypothetical protein